MIVDDVAHWAEVHPDKPALDYNARVWSYRDFAERIAVARGHLRNIGFDGDGVVALAIANIRDVWVTSLALRSLGLTTIALQPHHQAPTLPPSALRAVIVSGRETWPGLEAVCRDRGAALIAIAGYSGDALALDQARPDREGGHILQTSGTTGTLKFVRFDPAFEPAYFDQRRRANGVNAETVINLFDLAAWTGAGYKSPVSAWGVGASVVIHQQPDLHLALARPGVNVSVLVPSMLRLILAAPEGAFPRLPHMRLSVTGGALTTAEMAQARARITPRIDNGLGATESLCIAYTPMDTPDDHRWHIPAPDTQVEIVDDAGRPVPAGEMGRLRITTEAAPRGYLDDEEATRAFFADGFFYPGDLAVRRDDGRIALMGRVTDVINVAGHKLSPQPIEDRLREALGVTGVCLATRPNAAGEERLHAVIEAPAPLEPVALAAALRAELPEFARVRVHYTPALPRNQMGKVVRRAVAERLAEAPG